MAISKTTWRPGRKKTGGRKAGTPNRVTQQNRQLLERMKLNTKDPVSFWVSILQNPDAPYEEKKWASVQLGPFAHPKLASIEGRTGGQTHEERLEELHKVRRRMHGEE